MATPGVAKEYTASTSANVISTAGDATLSVADPSSTAPGHLVNGTFVMPQALQVKVLDALPSMVAANRRPAEELHGLVDDMIKLLESKALPDLRRGRYPDRAIGGRIAQVMRAVANELDA